MRRKLRSWPSFLALCGGALWTSCGPDPVGVEACRKIELARCEAAVACGIIEDAAACQRFFRDHCLHGVALDEEPGNVPVERCVDALELARECAEKHGPDRAPTACQQEFFKDADAENICEIVEEPERTPQCAFLVPAEPEKPDLDEDPDEMGKADAGAK